MKVAATISVLWRADLQEVGLRRKCNGDGSTEAHLIGWWESIHMGNQ